jgi:ATP-dependent Clp protease protease subunit
VVDKNETFVMDDEYSCLSFVSDNNTIFLSGPILGDTSEKFLQILHDVSSKKTGKKNLNIMINSPGGSLSDALAIYTMLECYKKTFKTTVTTFTYGICASAAIYIYLAGNERKCLSNTVFFMHDIQCDYPGFKSGQAMIAANKLVKHQCKLSNDIVIDKTNNLIKKNMMKDDTYYTAEDALKNGIVTEIIGNDGNFNHIFGNRAK